jgi:hypothetical protein
VSLQKGHQVSRSAFFPLHKGVVSAQQARIVSLHKGHQVSSMRHLFLIKGVV